MAYYANGNTNSSSTSRGFDNSNFTIRFETKKERDDYVAKQDNLGFYAISAKDAYASSKPDFEGKRDFFEVFIDEIGLECHTIARF